MLAARVNRHRTVESMFLKQVQSSAKVGIGGFYPVIYHFVFDCQVGHEHVAAIAANVGQFGLDSQPVGIGRRKAIVDAVTFVSRRPQADR